MWGDGGRYGCEALVHRFSVLGIPPRSAEGDFQRGAQPGERRSQLMRDVAHERPLSMEGRLDTFHELVEPRDDGLKFGRSFATFESRAERMLIDATNLLGKTGQGTQTARDKKR